MGMFNKGLENLGERITTTGKKLSSNKYINNSYFNHKDAAVWGGAGLGGTAGYMATDGDVYSGLSAAGAGGAAGLAALGYKAKAKDYLMSAAGVGALGAFAGAFAPQDGTVAGYANAGAGLGLLAPAMKKRIAGLGTEAQMGVMKATGIGSVAGTVGGIGYGAYDGSAGESMALGTAGGKLGMLAGMPAARYIK